ncbi:MAG: hypothetical protein R3F20_00570 [Planctomycetota bacterium]
MSEDPAASAGPPVSVAELAERLFAGLDAAWGGLLGETERPEAVEAGHLAALEALHALVARDPGPAPADLELRLAQSGDRLEERARTSFRDDAASPDRQARRAAVVRAQARILRRLTRWTARRPDADELLFLLLEIEAMEERLGGEGARETAISRRLEELRQAVVARHVDDVLRRADDPSRRDAPVPGAAPTSGDFGADAALASFRLAREFESSRSELRRERAAAVARGREGEVLERLDEMDERLAAAQVEAARRGSEFLAGVDSAADLDAARRAASLLADEIDEARLAAFDLGRTADPVHLRRLAEQGRRFARELRPARALAARLAATGEAEAVDRAASLDRHQRRLQRLSRRLGDVADDRVMGQRLENVFGRRGLRRWDTAIFWLIVVLLGLIVVNYYRDPDPERVVQGIGVDWAFWVDTVICSILLYDFLVRLVLHPSRLRFFARRFLTDFLPSLPLGLLAILHHGIPNYRLVIVAPRVLRVLRLLQPLVRVGRLALFFTRALDRLVERNAWFLNRNILFFSRPDGEPGEHVLTKRMRDLDGWIRRDTDALFEQLEDPAATEMAHWRADFIGLALRTEPCYAAVASRVLDAASAARDLDVDDVSRYLRSLDGRQVAGLIGAEFAESVTSSLRLFRLPGLRRLPVVRFVLGPTGAPDPLETTARLGHVLGDALAFGQRTINWFADLYGTITGAQFLDRLGMQLVKATANPAKRVAVALIVVGSLWLFISVVDARGQLDGVLAAARRFVTIPLLVVGIACAIPLVLGLWFRRIAGQAVDFYDRVAEAQFLALTEIEKEKTAPEDLGFLAERVLLPELRLEARGGDAAPEAREALSRAALGGPEGLREIMSEKVEGLDLSVCRTMLLFYREYIDGAFFHRNDTKIANLLVGNLTLENVRRHRLRFDRKRRRRLEALDIGRGRGGVTGPFVWFNFITHSVAQQTARLIIEYNQHAIPLAELEDADAEDREIHDGWLARRARLSAARASGDASAVAAEVVDGSRGTLTFRSTFFDSLHFLTSDPERDEEVRVRYGDRIADILVEDREHLVRGVFGTFPMHDLPREKRIFNPYVFYGRYASRGRIFLAPFSLAFFALRLLRLAARRVIAVIRDVIDPDARPLEASTVRADFDVARRKIHRMRRPVVMEAVRLRAELDVEYLGLSLPGRDDIELPENMLTEDLHFLDASEREWEEFRDMRSRVQARLRLLSEFLRERLGEVGALESWLVARSPGVARHPGASLRALTTAFACDHEDVAGFLEARAGLRRFVARHADREPEGRLLTLALVRRKGLAERLRAVESIAVPEGGWTEERRGRIVEAMLRAGTAGEEDLEAVEREVGRGGDPEARVLEVLGEVAAQPSAWTEQIAAVRTLQCLGMLDLRGYERLIRALGRYPEGA